MCSKRGQKQWEAQQRLARVASTLLHSGARHSYQVSFIRIGVFSRGGLGFGTGKRSMDANVNGPKYAALNVVYFVKFDVLVLKWNVGLRCFFDIS